jgi:hypothetical protein
MTEKPKALHRRFARLIAELFRESLNEPNPPKPPSLVAAVAHSDPDEYAFEDDGHAVCDSRAAQGSTDGLID